MLQDVINDTLVEAASSTLQFVAEPLDLAKILKKVVLPICIIAIVFSSIFGVLFFYLRSWHRQRMLMIEKGLIDVKKASEPNPKRNMMIAIMVLGAVAGWVVGDLAGHMLPPPFGAVGFAAIGYMVYYCIFVHKKDKKQE
ncbi:MAG: hypothetical protein LBK47_09190 [Prevotellaceae bacterium]|jgi:hypothetical protein|nr:hypothetical protein [Prevotellaceae bacterium]